MKITTVFITLQFKGLIDSELFDYPKNLPIPQMGETIIYQDYSGIVMDIRHIISGNIAEIKIIAD